MFVVKLAESDLTAQGKASDTKIWQVCVPGSQDYQSNYSFHYIFVRPSALAQDVAGEIIKFLFEQIKQIRIQFGWKPGTPIPPELNAIICMDGAGDILAKMIQMIADGDLDGLLLQILKWSAATTSKDQSNDVASTHRTRTTINNDDNLNGGITLQAKDGRELICKRLITCAGLQSDRVATQGDAGGQDQPSIIPFVGKWL